MTKMYKPIPQLGRCVQKQRKCLKTKQLSESENQIANLNEIGFAWDFNKDSWMTRYNDLIEYKRGLETVMYLNTTNRTSSWEDGLKISVHVSALKTNLFQRAALQS